MKAALSPVGIQQTFLGVKLMRARGSPQWQRGGGGMERVIQSEIATGELQNRVCEV